MSDQPDHAPQAPLPSLGAWVAVIGLGLGLLLLLAALLVSLRLEKALTDLVQARAVLMAQQLADAAEGGLRFGVPLADQTETPRKMDALLRNDPALRHMALLDEHGQPVRSASAPQHAGATPHPSKPAVLRLLGLQPTATADPPHKAWLSGPDMHVLMQVRDASGVPSGAVWLAYSAQEPRTALTHSLWQLGLWAVAMTAGVTLLLWALLWAVSRRTAQALATLDQRGPGQHAPPWPLLPAPQALRTLALLETELAVWAPLAPERAEREVA